MRSPRSASATSCSTRNSFTGDYTLPVDIGPRGSFGERHDQGDPVFGVDHIEVLRRFKPGELYDSRKVDDLRQALVATGLFSTVGGRAAAHRPDAGRTAPKRSTCWSRRTRGRTRTLAGTAGYGTGQGFRLEGSWTHRNLFPPEGALIVSRRRGHAGAGARRHLPPLECRPARPHLHCRRCGQAHTNYDAFKAFTGTLSARLSYNSTPIWQKKLTYFYGVELIGTNEERLRFRRSASACGGPISSPRCRCMVLRHVGRSAQPDQAAFASS